MWRGLRRGARRAFTRCLVVHPVILTRERPRVSEQDVYDCGEAFGLVKSIGWSTPPGPFENYRLALKAPSSAQAASPVPPAEGGEPPGSPAIGERTHILGYSALYSGGSYYQILGDEDEEEEGQACGQEWARLPENANIIKLPKVQKLFFFPRETLTALGTLMREQGLDVLFLNCFLSSNQLRNVRRKLNEAAQTGDKVVVDRLGVILQIFNTRARNELAKLQVALIYLQYLRSNFVREDDLLASIRDVQNFDILRPDGPRLQIASAKQSGNRGATGGEGEQELELQRRQARGLEAHIKERIKRAEAAQRERVMRKPAGLVTVALVGYTNAGKSALMNRFAGSEVVESRNMLFQTLYTVKRRVYLQGNFDVQLIDTIGFISHLPPELVAPFASTLEAVRIADIVLHVRDVSHPQTKQQKHTVLSVLDKLGLAALHANRKLIEVRNKVDLLRARSGERAVEPAGSDDVIYVSATTGEGVSRLRESIKAKIYDFFGCFRHRFEHSAEQHQQVVQWLREKANIKEIEGVEYGDDGRVTFFAFMNDAVLNAFNKAFHPEKFARGNSYKIPGRRR